MGIIREEPYLLVADVKYAATVEGGRLTSGVLLHLAAALVDQCGNDAQLDVTIVDGPGDERKLRIEVST